MKVAAGTIKSLGLCDDKNYVALRIAAESGELVALEFPTTLLPELSIIAVQLATKSSEKTGSEFDPPRLPVAKGLGARRSRKPEILL